MIRTTIGQRSSAAADIRPVAISNLVLASICVSSEGFQGPAGKVDGNTSGGHF